MTLWKIPDSSGPAFATARGYQVWPTQFKAMTEVGSQAYSLSVRTSSLTSNQPAMFDLTNSPCALEPGAASQILPLIYDELRILAAHNLAHEQPGHTLEATALVHQAYLRVVAPSRRQGRKEPRWDSQGHFFAAMAEAMRRILVENARWRARVKNGGAHRRVDLDEDELPAQPPPTEIIALDDALTKLAEEDPAAAQVVNLHFFNGLSIEQAAAVIGVSRATAYRQWSYARAWLRCQIGEEDVTSV
jgi:RNA polymerase sigma factor (TIGR02999 family)